KNLWSCGNDLFCGNAERRSARLAEKIKAPRALDHLRHPVSADVEGIEPLKKRDRGASRYAADPAFDGTDSRLQLGDKTSSTHGRSSFFADAQNVPPHITQILRIQAKNFWRVCKPAQDSVQIMGRCGADVAQVLRDNQIGSERLERALVYGIEAFPARNK